MEFAYLSDITGDPTYTKLVERVRSVIHETPRPKKLYPNYLNPKTGKWGQQHTSMGALGDSFYEYLLKEWLRSGKTDKIGELYESFVRKRVLVKYQSQSEVIMYIICSYSLVLLYGSM